MNTKKPRVNIFNSHQWNIEDENNKLHRDFLHNDEKIDYRFFEVNRAEKDTKTTVKKNNIEANLQKRIDLSTVVTIFNSEKKYNKNNFSNFEVNYAIKKNKPIIIIKVNGCEKIPLKFKTYRNKIIVDFDSKKIKDAINKFRNLNKSNPK